MRDEKSPFQSDRKFLAQVIWDIWDIKTRRARRSRKGREPTRSRHVSQGNESKGQRENFEGLARANQKMTRVLWNRECRAREGFREFGMSFGRKAKSQGLPRAPV
ncbi:hypothetical protein KI387_003935, partial [Taxus chinensis]